MHTAVPTLVLPAAGLGTRMKSVDPGRPKELLPVAGKPLIQHALALGLAAGVRTAVVVLAPGKEDIRRYIEERSCRRAMFPEASREMGRLASLLRIVFTEQARPDGECGAILTAREHCGRAPFAVLYPDNLLPGRDALGRTALEALLAGYRRLAARAEVPPHLLGLMSLAPEQAGTVSDSGRVELAPGPDPDWPELTRVLDFLPKTRGIFRPARPGEMRACGLYLAQPDWFEAMERARGLAAEGELTDGLVRRWMLERGGLFHGLPLPGPVFDAGNPEGYRACRAYLESGAAATGRG